MNLLTTRGFCRKLEKRYKFQIQVKKALTNGSDFCHYPNLCHF